MASKSKTSFKWNQAAVEKITFQFKRGLVKWGYAVANKARARAPYKSGALINSIRVAEENDQIFVTAGGRVLEKSIPYGLIQEEGGWAGRNHSVYIPGKHYLRQGLEDTLHGDLTSYFKGVA